MKLKWNLVFGFSILIILLSACQSTVKPTEEQVKVARKDVNKLLVVDCLLPSQIRKLGGQFTYLAARQPVRTTAINCEIRGGEYTSFDRADYRTALKVWLASAKEGDAEAQANVGEIYEKGLGVIPDYELARLWYEKSAAQKNARAQINLGYLYEKGFGVKKDLVQALNWYRRASGLVSNDLKFASEIEIQVAASSQKEVKKLRKEVKVSKQEAVYLKQQLDKKNALLKHHQSQLASSISRLKKLQFQTSQYVASGQASHLEQLTSLKTQIKRLKRSIGQQGNTIARLQSDVARQKIRLGEKVLLASASVDNNLTRLPGPTIKIMDQPLVLTRGLPILKLPVVNKYFKIMGHVRAPAGLLGFTINGRKAELNVNGLFDFRLPAAEKNKRIKMVAIDKGGRVARLIFGVEPITDFLMVDNQPSMIKAVNSEEIKGVSFGKYHALIIGNNNYKYYPKLKTAVNDAKRAAKVLSEKYGFKTRLLLNADRYTILTALNEIRANLSKQDNFLIYYAGHGEIDADNQRGYWLPVDAEVNNSANWISNLDITDMLNVINAKHIMVVADSCYSGTMTTTAQTRMSLGLNNSAKRNKWIKIMAKTRARVVLTSGGVKPVLDVGSGKHSVFANAFLTTLEKNKSVIEGYQLYQAINRRVQNRAAEYRLEQIPRYS
ncbi:MAG: hypothetical protein GXP13_06910, partial [Gammaproteobacteria bacterium]|nr:hypothetical protein [Gammaproteobacteria bacterium]